MESTSSQTFDSDESESFPAKSYDDDRDFVNVEFSESTDLGLDEHNNPIAESTRLVVTNCVGAIEPQIGMEFNSRDEAREFYISYGRHTGFTVRIHHNRRSRINNTVIGQDFVCSKEGFREKKYVYRKDRVLPPPPITREGCLAMFRVALRDGGKWVITKFVKDHNHSLLAPNKVPCRGSGKNSISQDEKDKRIKELTLELYNEKQRSKRRSAAYQEHVGMLLKFIDEHTDNLSKSVQDVIHNIRTLEKEQLKDSD